jgi:transposase-like protein
VVKAGLRDAWDAPTREASEYRIQELMRDLEEKAPRVAAWLDERLEETLAFFELATPAERLRLRSTNGIEHEHSEIRRPVSRASSVSQVLWLWSGTSSGPPADICS